MSKNYLIVGGSSGIGSSLVNVLSTKHQVFATYYTHPKISEHPITYLEYDVKSEKKLELPVESLDGLVYCPGTINLKPFHRLSQADFLEDFQINLLGAVKVIQDVLPIMKKAENPSIVLFSTVAVQQGMAFHGSVAAGKGAVEGITRSLAAELAPKIRVNAIAPSITNTPLASRLLNSDEKISASQKRHPLQKIGTPDNIAALAAFLLSDDAAWITGQILHADGGLSSIKML